MSPLASPTVVLTERSTIRETVMPLAEARQRRTQNRRSIVLAHSAGRGRRRPCAPSSQSCDGGDVALSDAKGVEQPRDRDDVALPEPQ